MPQPPDDSLSETVFKAAGKLNSKGVPVSPADVLRSLRPGGPLDRLEIRIWCDACRADSFTSLRSLSENGNRCLSCGSAFNPVAISAPLRLFMARLPCPDVRLLPDPLHRS